MKKYLSPECVSTEIDTVQPLCASILFLMEDNQLEDISEASAIDDWLN